MKTRNLFVASLMASVALPTVQEAYAQSLALEEIVVTARKRDESIFEIPVSVTAISDEFLAQSGIDDAQTLSAFVPGLDFQQSGPAGLTSPNIRFRGMIQQVLLPSTQIGALFWNGSYIGGGGGFLPLGDLERVEVIKGPQTAYFGRATFGGAINYIPKRPGDEWEGDISVEMSPTGHNEYSVDGGIGGPITDDLGIRLWAGYEKDGGDFSFDDGTPFAQKEVITVNSTVDYDVTDDLRVSVTGYYSKADDTGYTVSQLATVPSGACDIIYSGSRIDPGTGERTPFTTDLSQSPTILFCGDMSNNSGFEFPATSTPNSIDLTDRADLSKEYGILRDPDGALGGWHQTYRVQAEIEYDISDHIVNFQVSQANTGTVNRGDGFFGNNFIPVLGPDFVSVGGSDQRTKESYYQGRVTSPQDQRFRYLAGISYYDQKFTSIPQLTRIGSSAVIDERTKTFGIFAGLDYDVTENLTISAEGRYQEEDFNNIYQGVFDEALFGGSTEECDLSPIQNCKNKTTGFLPRLIVSYTPMDGATAYANWSQSKIPGLATQAAFILLNEPDLVPPGTSTFTPDQKATQYEIGWKQQWENWNMTLAIYHMDWDNQPIPTVVFLPDTSTSSLRLPGSSEYRGFDLEVAGNVTEWWNVRGSLAYVDTKMTRYDNFGSNERVALQSGGPVDSAGNPARNAIPWTASLSSTFAGVMQEREWYIRTDVTYQSSYFNDYSAYNRVQESIKVNLRAGIQVLDNVEFQVFGTNIFNDLTLPSSSGTTLGYNFGLGQASRKTFGTVPQAREFGVRINADF